MFLVSHINLTSLLFSPDGMSPYNYIQGLSIMAEWGTWGKLPASQSSVCPFLTLLFPMVMLAIIARILYVIVKFRDGGGGFEHRT